MAPPSLLTYRVSSRLFLLVQIIFETPLSQELERTVHNDGPMAEIGPSLLPPVLTKNAIEAQTRFLGVFD